MCNKCTCHKDTVSCDPASIEMKAKLDASSDYFYTITDSKGNTITKEFTTDEDGNWEIPSTDLPNDFLVQGTKFKIIVTKTANDNQPQNMLVTTPANCIEVEVKCIDGEAKEFIGW